MKIGVIGLGTVGYGVIEILTNERKRLEKVINDEVMIKDVYKRQIVHLPLFCISPLPFNLQFFWFLCCMWMFTTCIYK